MIRNLAILGATASILLLGACRTDPPTGVVDMILVPDVIVTADGTVIPQPDMVVVPDGGPPPDTNPPPDIPVGPDGGPAPVDTSIAGIQDRSSPTAVIPNSQVRLTGVIALTKKTFIAKRDQGTGCLYGVWIADAAGGPYSGIQITADGTDLNGASDCPDGDDSASGGVIPSDVAIGDTFDVAGQYQEFFLSSASATCMENTGATCTATYSQITAPFPSDRGPLVMTRTAQTAAMVAPAVLSDTEVTDLRAARGVSNATVAKYRGTLIQINNATVTCPNIGYGTDVINGTTCNPSTGGGDAGMFMGGSSDGIYVQSKQDFEYSAAKNMFEANDSLTKVVGVVDYNQFDGIWRVVPRTNADVVKAP